MTNKRFSELPAAGALDGTEIVAVTQGGASARTTLNLIKSLFGVGGKFAANIGDGSAASFNVSHGLGTKDVKVVVYRNATPWDDVVVDVSRPDNNTVTISGFGVAPSVNQFRVLVWS